MGFNFKKGCDLTLCLLCLSFILILWRSPGRSEADIFKPVRGDESAQFSESFTFHLKIARVLSEKDALWSEAEKEFQLAKKINPRNYQPYLGIARLALKKEDWTLAAGNYRRAVERNPDLTDNNAKAYLGKELISFTKEAIRRFRDIERKKPRDSVNSRNLKNAYYLKRKLAGGCD